MFVSFRKDVYINFALTQSRNLNFNYWKSIIENNKINSQKNEVLAGLRGNKYKPK